MTLLAQITTAEDHCVNEDGTPGTSSEGDG
jgi:hypothetical protein